jgi:hypothetical protein
VDCDEGDYEADQVGQVVERIGYQGKRLGVEAGCLRLVVTADWKKRLTRYFGDEEGYRYRDNGSEAVFARYLKVGHC